MPLMVSNTSGLSTADVVLCSDEPKLDKLLEFAQESDDSEL
jgi:hypothetical protein